MGMLDGLTGPIDRAFDYESRSGMSGGNEGKSDAMRHGLWMGGTARAVSDAVGGGKVGTTLGPIAAKLLGLVYEGVSFPKAAWTDGMVPAAKSALMDINNNAVGARIGVEANSESDMQRRMLEAVERANYNPSALTPGGGMVIRTR